MFDDKAQRAGLHAILVRAQDLEGRVAEASGVINAGHGRLVDAAIELLAEGKLGLGPGVHTPAAWLCWKAGLSPSKAHDVERLARRADELPDTVAALRAGELSLDQASVIARHVPSDHERSACDLAKVMTVRQLRRTLPNYGYDADVEKPGNHRDRREAERSVSSGTDATGWWARMRMPADEGAVFEAAWKAKQDQLFRARQAQDGDDADRVDGVDALLAMAESALADLDAKAPGTDRYLVHLHLEANPDGDGDSTLLGLHMGPNLGRGLRRFLTCDPKIRTIIHTDTKPVDAGRTTRVINRALRRIVEHRDGGCAVPGCPRTRGLEIHHIWHWEDGGPTDTANLLALCRRHHRDHHHDRLGIAGNPDLALGTEGAVAFTDQAGRPMAPTGAPIPPTPGLTPRQGGLAIGLAPQPYRCPLNHRLDPRDFYLQRTRGPAPPDEPDPVADGSASSDAKPWDRCHHHAPPGGAGDHPNASDPTRAGPHQD